MSAIMAAWKWRNEDEEMDSSGITRPKDQQDDGTEDDEEVVADLVVGCRVVVWFK